MKAEPKATSAWATAAERGSVIGLRFLVFCYRGLGRRVSGWLLYPVVAYFLATAPAARLASRRYFERLQRMGGAAVPRARPGIRTIFLHFLTFAELALDRFGFWAGSYDEFDIRIHGADVVRAYLAEGQGVVVIGAHLGSFDVLRALGRDEKVSVNAVMFTGNAERINETFRQLSPDGDLRMIEVDPGSVRSALEIKQCLDRGELVAFPGDRVDPAGRGRVRRVPFLGAQAPFLESPFLLPMVIGSPVVLGLALRTSPNRYELFFELLAKPGRVQRARRNEVLQERMEDFARRLERYCEMAPFQWFNFYDFWEEDRKLAD